ncbi:MAG: ribosome biogenesis factor YjgA [Pseudomonadota bacterium]
MAENKGQNGEDERQDGPSKTALKRKMTALQALGESLAELGDRELAKVPIEDERLRQAIQEVRRIKSRSARRRHMQLIGKLMRQIDPAPIEAALDGMRRARLADTNRFHELETLREAALIDGLAGVETVMARFPSADRQQLRQLLLQHQREQKAGKPPAASRKLFKYLRELQEFESGTG